LNINTNNPLFRVKHLPHDGDVISIVIQSTNKNFRPIRCDFLIINNSTHCNDDRGDDMNWSFQGVLNNPLFRKLVSFCLPQKTSLEAIEEIAKKTGMGFATNQDKMNDKMN
jgi:hypothetical protein